MSGAVLRRVVGWVAGVAGAALAVLAAAGVLPAFAQAGGFGDVAVGAYYSAPVQELAGLGVLTGCEGSAGFDDSRFCPGEPMDRKTMAVWVVRVLDGEDPPPGRSRFPDVNRLSAFWWPFVERMAELGVTKGCGDGANFCPDDPVTRAQMAVFLWRAFDLPDGPDPGFSDVPGGAWYYDGVAALAASGITQGCGSGTTFCPGDDTTRAQTATFLSRARQRTEAAADDTSATPQASTSSGGGGGGGGGGQRTVTTTTVTTTTVTTTTVTTTTVTPVAVRFGAASHTATEGGAAATVQVVLSADPERTVDVPLTVTRSGGATPGDYTVSATGVTFHAGQTTASFTVTAIDDSNDDDGESVTIRFGTLPPGVTAASPNTARVALADNDDPLGRVTMTLPAGCVLRDLVAGNEMPYSSYYNGCDSLHVPGRNAHYYRLVVREQGTVTLGVVGTTASHLLIRSASGEVIERYVEPGEIQYYRLSVTRTLDAGTYVIEVAAQWSHYRDHGRGHTLSYSGPTIARPARYKLAELAITDVNLEHFTPGTTEYRRNVAGDVGSVTVTPTATLDDAEVTVMPPDADPSTDGYQVDIDADVVTEITVTVNSPMIVDVETEYRVELRQLPGTTAPLSDDTGLSSLSFDKLDIGDFSSDKTDYKYPLGYYERLRGTTATMTLTTVDGATWTANLSDENEDVASHQLSIDGDGTDTILVTVTSQDKANTREYRVAPEAPMTRDASRDICSSCDVSEPYGLWSDGESMMTISRTTNTLHVFDMETKKQQSTFALARPSYQGSYTSASRGLWSNGEILWVLYREIDSWKPHENNLLYAYSLETRARLPDEDILFPDEWGSPVALWIDGERMYLPTFWDILYIYTFPGASDVARVEYDSGFDERPSESTRAIWSDGTTLWMALRDAWVRAYDADSGRRIPGLDFRTGPQEPRGLWSDGRTMWVIDVSRGYPQAYSMLENARLWKLSVSDGDIGNFHNGKFDYDVEVPAGTASTTITAEAAFDGGSSSIVFSGSDADGHQVALTPGEDAVVTITVTAPNGTDTEVYTVTITHAS